MMERASDGRSKPIWYTCTYCIKHTRFSQLHDFTRHLRTEHCSVEGGSFVCRYGYNSVCNSLPLEGVSDLDYADHIMKHHAFAAHNAEGARRKQSTGSEKSVTSLQGCEQVNWLAVSSSQNLAAVLNDPGRGKQRDFFTKLWGIDFVETPLASIPPNPNLASITRASFEGYLRKVGKRHRRHEQLCDETRLQAVQRRRGARDRRLDPLDMPPIFLQAEFNLSTPATFYTAVPFAKTGITVDGTFRINSKLLQEKLAHSLDQVEMRIADQVADKSEGFFAAMTSHDTLMEQLSKMVGVVRGVRGRLSDMDKVVAYQALHALTLTRRLANHKILLNKLKLMRTVHQTQPQIQILLSAPDYVAALELIVTSQHIVEHQLDSVYCFRHLGPQLTEITRLIDKMMATEFESYSTKDLNRPLTHDLHVLEQEKLVCIMLGMLRRGSTSFIGQYQDEALTAIRALVKQVVLEQLAESDCETHGVFSERVQSLPLVHFLQLMDVLTTQLARLLRKIKGVHDVIKDTIEMAAGRKSEDIDGSDVDGFSFLGSKELEKGQSELQKLMIAVCGFAHEECGKLLTNVTLDTASGNQVCDLGHLVERFCKDCTELSGRSPAALRAAFQVAASRFILKFHNERKDQLNSALDCDQWKAADVPHRVQLIVTHLVDGRGFVPSSDCASTGSQGHLLVGNEKYIIVGCAITLVSLLHEYALLARELSLLAWTLQRDLVELLTLFNSRSCQLVLGAGAVHTAVLKTITTTSLVLASRALQLFIWLLPHIKTHFEEVMVEQRNGRSWTSQFEDVEKNMSDHMDQLQGKVVLIMSSVVSTELLLWAAKPPVPSQAFRNISRNLTKLHEAVRDVLPISQIEILYRKINEKFKAALREQIKKLNIVNNGGPQHGIVTSELTFYVELLKKLNVLPNEDLSENSLADIWQHKSNV